MSLSRLIKDNKEARAVFKEQIGNVKKLFKTENGEVPFGKIAAVVPIPSSSDWIPQVHPQNVGTAYDYWLRAYIQRENNILKEEESPKHLLGVIPTITFMFYSSDDDFEFYLNEKELKKQTEDIWKMRNDYILGKKVDEDELIKGMLRLTYLENHFRNSGVHIRPKGYTKVDEIEFLNLKELVEQTKKADKPSFFTIKNKDEVIFNPIFGKYSAIVGGADGDLIVDEMLVDFKTSKDYTYLGKDVYQIIGYYMLDKFNKGENGTPLKKIGIYYSRYNQFVYIDTEELEKQVNIQELGEKLFEISKKLYPQPV